MGLYRATAPLKNMLTELEKTNEISRHQELLGHLVVSRLDMEKTWLHSVDGETPMPIIESLIFQTRCLDIALVYMIGRARLINPEMVGYTNSAITMTQVLLRMERDSVDYGVEMEAS